MTNAPLLERMVDLTAIRDADLLDLSLVRTVREVCAAEELSLRRIAPDGRSMAETRLRDDGRLSLTVAEIHHARTRIQLAEVHGPGDVVQLQEDGRPLLVYPMMKVRGIRTCLRVAGARIAGIAKQAMLQRFARFFQNYRSLRDDAQREALTGLRNHKTFDDVILRLFAGGAESAAEQGVAGDRLLFRFGDEEFVIVLRGVDCDTAVSLFERFRLAVAELPVPAGGAGHAQYRHRRTDPRSADQRNAGRSRRRCTGPSNRAAIARRCMPS